MNASKAKRRLIRWHRYLASTKSMPLKGAGAGYHTGHAKAHWDYMIAGRAAPRGIRVPLTRFSMRGDDF